MFVVTEHMWTYVDIRGALGTVLFSKKKERGDYKNRENLFKSSTIEESLFFLMLGEIKYILLGCEIGDSRFSLSGPFPSDRETYGFL